MEVGMEIFALREFNLLFILLDCIWLIFLFFMLRIFNRRQALKVGLIGGVLYFLVDYGIFYLLLGTRQVTGGYPFWVLAWMSMSYGFTNFAWIWLMLDRDRFWVEWTVLIVSAWLAVALLSQNFGANLPAITTGRGTLGYHGVMAAILFFGYAYLIYRNLDSQATGGERINLMRLIGIGIGVQLGWEAVLLVSGVRPAEILPLVVNSLIETNLGLPYLYLIHRAVNHFPQSDSNLRLLGILRRGN
jgi:hypothetical protein